jgi:hypothetical protein
MALFFAWILGHMRGTDTRIRTERLMALQERPLRALLPGEVNATRGTLVAAGDALTCPVDGAPCLFYELSLTRTGSVRGEARATETVQEGTHYAKAALQAGDEQVALALRGALLPAGAAEVTREASWRDDAWVDDTWTDGGWFDAEREFVAALDAEGPSALRGELDAGTLRLRYRQLPLGLEVLALGELTLDERGARTLGSSTRFQLELTRGSLEDYRRAQLSAQRTMQRASRAFVVLALGLALLAGLTYARVLP